MTMERRLQAAIRGADRHGCARDAQQGGACPLARAPLRGMVLRRAEHACAGVRVRRVEVPLPTWLLLIAAASTGDGADVSLTKRRSDLISEINFVEELAIDIDD